MGMCQYLISDMSFSVFCEFDYFIRNSKFEINNSVINSDSIVLELCCDQNNNNSDSSELLSIMYQKLSDGYKIIFIDKNKRIVNEIQVNKDLTRFKTSVQNNQMLHPFEKSIGEVVFRTSILLHDGIVVHSAGIDCNGNGILFSAPSGTGKSTQANLWKQYRNANILNGDRAALRIINGRVYIFGTPWSGSSNENMDSRAPLKGIFFLQQAKENSLRLLTPSEALSYMLPRCFLPYGCEDLMDLALKNIEQILNKVPAYLFRCLPDYEAVEMVSNCLGVQDHT